jgi:hypothetical protein
MIESWRLCTNVHDAEVCITTARGSDVDMYVAAYWFLVLLLSGVENDHPQPLEMIFKVVNDRNLKPKNAT